ncbi:conserved hypothetical protein [Frankia sp. Hr75.2]|nr:conserved hypothetical protein [Frankia sp. Hr75.2]
MPAIFTRSYALDDIHISRSAADGRTVEAYASVFDAPTEISDHQGEYVEVIDRTAFDRATRSGHLPPVMFNHGRTIHGESSDRFSMPIGTTIEMRADGRGLLTRARYARTELADEVLELIRDGAISAQSFSGRIVRSDPPPPSGGYRRSAGKLPTVRRLEIDLREYGPAVFAAYKGAAIMNVRSTSTGTDLSRKARDARNRIRAREIIGTPAQRSREATRIRAKIALFKIDHPDLYREDPVITRARARRDARHRAA